MPGGVVNAGHWDESGGSPTKFSGIREVAPEMQVAEGDQLSSRMVRF